MSDTLTSTNSIWAISSYIDEGLDETTEFTGYQFAFETSGSVNVQNEGTTKTDTWSSQDNAMELLLSFGTNMPLDDLNEDWNVISISNTRIELQDINDDTGNVEATLIIENL